MAAPAPAPVQITGATVKTGTLVPENLPAPMKKVFEGFAAEFQEFVKKSGMTGCNVLVPEYGFICFLNNRGIIDSKSLMESATAFVACDRGVPPDRLSRL